MLADLQRGDTLKLPARLDRLEHWRRGEYRLNALIELPQENARPGYLLLVASGELPSAFYTGTLTASLAILGVSVLLWLLVAQQIRRLITRPIRDLEELSRQVTREENYALRAQRGNGDEIGRLADAFNTMLTRIEAREQQLKRARDDAQEAVEQAQSLAEETRRSNRKLELEVQVRSKIEKKLTGFQHYLNSIIDSMPSALIAVDEQLYVTQWNQEASQLSGTSLDDAVNQPVFLAFPSLKPFLPQLTRAAEKHSVERVERVTWALIDTPRHYAPTFYPLMGGTGRGAVIRIDDITQRLSLEEVMVQSEKMLGRQPRRRHGPRDQQPARRDPAQRAEHQAAPVPGAGEERRAGGRGRSAAGRHQSLPRRPRHPAPAGRHPARRLAGSEDRHPHARLQPPQPPADDRLRTARTARTGGGNRR